MPTVGARGLARLGGRWTEAVVRAVHPSGTLSVDEEERLGGFMADWHSLCPHDWVEDDLGRLGALAGGAASAGPEPVRAWFAAVGISLTPETVAGWWTQVSTQVFGEVLPERPLAEVHTLLRAAGWAAAALDPARRAPQWDPLWWNQVRMGGGDPDAAPPVGVDEAAAALGLPAGRDAAEDAALAAFAAAHGPLPAEVTALAGRAGFAAAFRDAHCNNPEWRPVERWEVVDGLRAAGLPGERGVVAVDPHQGEHAWALVFDAGDATASVAMRYPRGDGHGWVAAAPTVSFFLWDLVRARDDWARGMAAPAPKP
jgi:hypothetical protein